MQIRKERNKFLALLLVCVMTLTMLGSLALADGPYTITIKNQQTDTNGQMLSGAVYEIKQIKGAYNPSTQAYDAPTYQTKKVTIPASGEITETVPEGTYEIKEISPAQGMVSNKETAVVELPTADLKNAVTVHPKSSEIRSNEVIIKLVDGDTNAPLAGAKFKLARQKADGKYEFVNPLKVFVGDNISTELTTNSNGEAIFNGLPFGNYKIYQEASIPGYFKTSDIYNFEINEANMSQAKNHTFKNFKKPVISKTTLGFEDLNDEKYSKLEPVSGKNEKIVLEKDKLIRYRIELKLAGNTKDYKQFEITDVLNDQLDISNVASSLTVNDGFKATLDGRTIKVVNESYTGTTPMSLVVEFDAKVNSSVAAGTSIANIARAIIEDNNTFNPSELPKPDLDPKVNPKDPQKPGNTQEVSTEPGGNNGTDQEGGNPADDNNNVTTSSGSFKLTKIDGSNETIKLEGVEFKLFRLNDVDNKEVEVGVYTTNKNGTVMVEDLHYGKYKLQETKTAKGYRLLDKKFSLTVDKENDNKEVVVKNYKSTSVLPDTGTLGMLPFAALGTAFISAGVFLVKKREDNKK